MMRPVLPYKSEINFKVEQVTDVAVVQTIARQFAASHGFSIQQQWEFAIAVSEAASNIVKYASSGLIALGYCESESEASYLEFETKDEGTGIGSIDLALKDDVSEGVHLVDEKTICARRGLGLGLGTIQRLMDNISIENMEPAGVRVYGRKYRK